MDEVAVRNRRRHALLVMLALCAGVFPFRSRLGRPVVAVVQVMMGKKTVGDRLA
jgi:hypothetical protein